MEDPVAVRKSSRLPELFSQLDVFFTTIRFVLNFTLLRFLYQFHMFGRGPQLEAFTMGLNISTSNMKS